MLVDSEYKQNSDTSTHGSTIHVCETKKPIYMLANNLLVSVSNGNLIVEVALPKLSEK